MMVGQVYIRLTGQSINEVGQGIIRLCDLFSCGIQFD
jgi:hypothetical protein